MVDLESPVGRAILDTHSDWRALATPVTAIAGFARRKPLGALGGFIVMALIVVALLAPVLAPYDPRQIIREANQRVPVYVPPGSGYPFPFMLGWAPSRSGSQDGSSSAWSWPIPAVP
jgi:hypothetical protein